MPKIILKNFVLSLYTTLTRNIFYPYKDENCIRIIGTGNREQTKIDMPSTPASRRILMEFTTVGESPVTMENGTRSVMMMETKKR